MSSEIDTFFQKNANKMLDNGLEVWYNRGSKEEKWVIN